jgi:hypothetical protein
MLEDAMNYPALVRRLLRAVHRPHELERDVFGLALKRASGEASVRAALQSAIAQAFPDADVWSVHRTILQRYDLEQRVPRYRAAVEMGLSPRRFYYLHAEAVDLLAHHVAQMMHAHAPEMPFEHLADLLLESDPARAGALMNGDAANPQAALKSLYAAIVSNSYRSKTAPPAYAFKGTDAALAAALHALQLEQRGRRRDALRELDIAHERRCDHLGNPSHSVQLAILNARALMASHDGNAGQLCAAARAAHAYPSEMPHGFEDWRTLLAVEAALALGEPDHALNTLDAALPAAVERGAYRTACLLALCEARALFAKGDLDAASRAARSVALCARSHADIASAAFLLRARIALALGVPLPSPRPPAYSLWDDLYARALLARNAGAADEARAVEAEASHLGYSCIAAHAAATGASVSGDAPCAVAAWRVWLQGRDMLQGIDFAAAIPARALCADPSAAAAAHELAFSEHPEWPVLKFLTAPHTAAHFWSALLAGALEGGSPEAIAPAVSAVLAAPVAAPLPAPAVNGAAGIKAFSAALSYLLPFEERARFRAGLAALLVYVNARARRAIERERARSVWELSG